MNVVPVWFLVASLVGPCYPARILAILSTPSRSHHFFSRALTLELAARGHHVTVFSPDPEEQPVPNHRDIVFEHAYAVVGAEYDYQLFPELSHTGEVQVFFGWGLAMCEKALWSDGGRRLVSLAKNETFDLIIFEVTIQECLLPIISLFGNPPVVGFAPYGNPPWANDMMGNDQNPSFVNTLALSDRMTLLQRLGNFLFDSFVRGYRRFVYLPKQDEISRKFFGASVPLPSQLESNISLVMVNAQFSTNYPQPQVPGIVPVHGLLMKAAKPLPKELQDFLDSSPDVVYMSLGTNVRSDKLREHNGGPFSKPSRLCPRRCSGSGSLPGQPPNVKTIKWAPQNDVLSKLFTPFSLPIS